MLYNTTSSAAAVGIVCSAPNGVFVELRRKHVGRLTQAHTHTYIILVRVSSVRRYHQHIIVEGTAAYANRILLIPSSCDVLRKKN